jgi:hypothetical protein
MSLPDIKSEVDGIRGIVREMVRPFLAMEINEQEFLFLRSIFAARVKHPCPHIMSEVECECVCGCKHRFDTCSCMSRICDYCQENEALCTP